MAAGGLKEVGIIIVIAVALFFGLHYLQSRGAISPNTKIGLI